MNVKISFQLNGNDISVEGSATRRVIDLLREDLRLTGSKEGCGTGECGACSILVDGEVQLACLLLAGQLAGRQVMTIDGLRATPCGSRLQQAFAAAGAVQCGYCIPGMEMAASALLARQPHPSREEIRMALSGNLCRCTGYVKIVDAVEQATPRLASDKTEERQEESS